MTTFIAKKLVLDNQILDNFGLITAEGRIVSLISGELITPEEREKAVLTDYLMPGFIDVHVHGSAGFDVMDATAEALSNIQKSLVSNGTTSFLATTMTLPQQAIENALTTIRENMREGTVGARLIGAHLEGPFIQPKAKGAHVEAFIQTPSAEWVAPYQDIVKLITMAPETDVDQAALRAFKSMGIKVSLGHSAASYDCACQAIEAGADSVTHLFNAMSGLHHRDPGLVGAALLKPVYAELIADGVHVHPDLYELVYRLKGEDKLILITDAMKGQCMRSGEYDLGGQRVIVTEQDARLTDGTLAGSVLTQHKALKNMLQTDQIDLIKLSKMLSTNPANLLGLTDCGRIAVGARADLVCMNEALEIESVWVDGQCAFLNRP